MTAAQRKKAKAIARKKRVQAEKKEAERLKAEAANSENGGKKAKKSDIDIDPDGEELLKKDPLEEGKKYSAILSKHCPNRFETWALQYDVSIRRKKWLLALQALFKMRDLDSNNAGYFSRLVEFAMKVPDIGDLPEAVKNVITEEGSGLLNQKSVTEYVSEASDKASKDKTTGLPLRVEIAKTLIKYNSAAVEEASAIIVDGGIDSRGVNVQSCILALNALKAIGSASTQQWISDVLHRYPRIPNFS